MLSTCTLTVNNFYTILVDTLKNIEAEIPCNPPANFPYHFKFDLCMCNIII